MIRKLVIIAALFMAVEGVRAQDCEALMLPYFGNDRVKMENYQAEAPYKYEWRCAFAKTAFYEADDVPADADVFQISEIKDKFTGNYLSANYVVDLNTLSYYGYTFHDFQLRYPNGNKTLCFATPGSVHPYLVLRSIEDMHRLTNEMTNNNDSNR